MEVALNQKEVKIIRGLEIEGVSEDGIRALTSMVDPFHDVEYDHKGWPDNFGGHSVIYEFNRETALSATADGDQFLIHMTPLLVPIETARWAPDNPGGVSGLMNPANNPMAFAKNVTDPTNPMMDYGGLMCFKAGAGFDFQPQNLDIANGAILAPFTDLNTLTPGTASANSQDFLSNFPAQLRVIGCAFEVRDVSATLYKSGSSLSYRQEEVAEKDLVKIINYVVPPLKNDREPKATTHSHTKIGAVINPTPLNTDGLVLPLHPKSASEIKLIPTTKSAMSSDGTYQVAQMYGVDNIPSARQDVLPIIADLEKYSSTQLLPCLAPIAQTNIVELDDDTVSWTSYERPTIVGQFKPFGILFQGLAAQTKLLVTAKWIIEAFPDSDNKALVPLIKPSSRFDPKCLEIASRIMYSLPISTPVRNNAAGGWFAGAVNAAKFVGPLLGAMPDPRAKAIGGLLTAGTTMYDSAKGTNMEQFNGQIYNQSKQSKQQNKNQAKAIGQLISNNMSNIERAGQSKKKKSKKQNLQLHLQRRPARTIAPKRS